MWQFELTYCVFSLCVWVGWVGLGGGGWGAVFTELDNFYAHHARIELGSSTKFIIT